MRKRMPETANQKFSRGRLVHHAISSLSIILASYKCQTQIDRHAQHPLARAARTGTRRMHQHALARAQDRRCLFGDLLLTAQGSASLGVAANLSTGRLLFPASSNAPLPGQPLQRGKLSQTSRRATQIQPTAEHVGFKADIL